MPEFTPLFLIFFFLYLFQTVFTFWLEHLNRRIARKEDGRVPEAFQDFISRAKMRQAAAYLQESSRFSSVQQLVSDLFLLGLILFGFFPFLDGLLSRLPLAPMLTGLLFFILSGLLRSLVDLPFDYYETFVIEEKYGFNRSTRRLWVLDRIKAGMLSLILLSLTLFVVLWLIQSAPHTWWIWGFLFLTSFQLLFVVVYPLWIAPWFNTFEVIADEELKEKITGLMRKAGVGLRGVFKMDAGKRSGRTNAYFTGLGRSKRVVLFDTLLQMHPSEEILGILAHEVGHYKKNHIVKQFLFFSATALGGLLLAALLLPWEVLYHSFGFDQPKPYVGLFLITLIGIPIGFFMAPISAGLGRHFERAADSYAVSLLGNPGPLITAFKRMAADNLVNLHPHPWYVRFYHAHPPIPERIRRLSGKGG